MRSFIVAAISLSALGCGASTPQAHVVEGEPRHTARVEAVVLRNLTVERGELAEAQRAEVRHEAVVAVADAMDDLTPTEVDGVRIDIQIAELDRGADSTRARVMLTLHTVGPPERTRAILQGAARAPGVGEQDAARASAGAIQSAVRGLPAALAAVN